MNGAGVSGTGFTGDTIGFEATLTNPCGVGIAPGGGSVCEFTVEGFTAGFLAAEVGLAGGTAGLGLVVTKPCGVGIAPGGGAIAVAALFEVVEGVGLE